MAQFDVFRLADGGLVLDCQSDLFEEIGTRFAIPLVPAPYSPPTNARLNPSLTVSGEQVMLVTQFATAVRTTELRQRVDNLADHRLTIIHALDTLTGSA